MAITLAIATYAILKPSTSADDLVFLPNSLVEWLDTNFNFRTYVMAWGVCVVPAILLCGAKWANERRGWLMLLLSFLLILECTQMWIPTRGFSWEDLGYTVGGVLTAEIMAMLTSTIVGLLSFGNRSPQQNGW